MRSLIALLVCIAVVIVAQKAAFSRRHCFSPFSVLKKVYFKKIYTPLNENCLPRGYLTLGINVQTYQTLLVYTGTLGVSIVSCVGISNRKLFW